MIPHYISEDMLSLLAASGEDVLDSGQILYSDRQQANVTGQFILSKNRKSFAWMSPAGNLVIYSVKNPADDIADASGNLTDPNLRYESFNLWQRFPDAKSATEVVPGKNAYTMLQVTQSEVAVVAANGKKAILASIPAGAGLVQLKILDDGNLTITQNNKPIWNLFTSSPAQGGPGAGMPGGLNLGSLLVPALGLALLLYLKK